MKSNFIRNVFLLAGGTASAQLLNIVFLPILTRLYDPSEFGVYSIFVAINAILTVITTLKYENAIISTNSYRRAENLCIILFYTTFSLSLVVSFLYFIICLYIAEDFNIAALVFSSFLSILFSSWFLILYFWNNKHSNYKVMARGRVIAVISMLFFSILYGYFIGGVEGLLFGNAISFIVNFVYMRMCGVDVKISIAPFFRGYAIKLLKCFSNFPKFLVVSSLLDRSSAQTHLFMFGSFYGASMSGWIGMHTRIIALPTSLICNAVADVFKRQAAEKLANNGNCIKLFFNTSLYLFAIATPIAMTLLFFAPELFKFFLGQEWSRAGEISQILSISFWFSFIVSPLSSLIYLEDNQHYDLYLQIYLFFSLLIGLPACMYLLNFDAALWFFVLVYSSKYLIEYMICAKICKGRI